jgi:hypothetical protein
VAERFDLLPTVRKQLHDPDDPVDLVRAILQAAGMDPSVEGELIRVGDRCVVVLQGPGAGAIGREILYRAYLLMQRVGRARRLWWFWVTWTCRRRDGAKRWRLTSPT